MRSASSTSPPRIWRFGCLGRTFCRSSSASTGGPRPQTSTCAISKEASWNMYIVYRVHLDSGVDKQDRPVFRYKTKKRHYTLHHWVLWAIWTNTKAKTDTNIIKRYRTLVIWIHRKVSMSPLDRPELKSASSSNPKLPDGGQIWVFSLRTKLPKLLLKDSELLGGKEPQFPKR